jgi:hypothetical protein
MEDKRKSKCSCSPFKEGSSPLSSVSTPLPVTSGSPPPPGSHSEVSSRHPYQLVLEQGGPSKKISVVDLSYSSDEEDLIPDITRGAEFTKNYLATSTMSSLDHSSTARSSSSTTLMRKKEEVCEEDVETVPASAVKSPAPTTSTANAVDTNKARSPDRVIGDSSSDKKAPTGSEC